MSKTVVVFEPASAVVSDDIQTVYCNECCDFIPLDDEGDKMCSLCNPEHGMKDEYDEEIGLRELNFHDEDDYLDRS